MKFSLLGSLVSLLTLAGCSEQPPSTPVSTLQVPTTPSVTPVASTIDLADPLASTPSDPFLESTGLPMGDDGNVLGSAWELDSPLMGPGTSDVLPLPGESQGFDMELDSTQFDSGGFLPK